MPRHAVRTSKTATTVLATMLAITAFSGCTTTSTEPTSSPSEGQHAVTYPEINDAVRAADPRVQNVSVLESQSGASRVLTVGVRFGGDEPVTSETLTAVLIAIRESLPDEIDQVDLIPRDNGDPSQLIDVTDAVDGLPGDVTVLYDGALTIMRADLDKLAG